MADAAEHAKVILSAIIPGRPDLLDVVSHQLEESHFIDPDHRAMFQLLTWYLDKTQAIMTRDAIADQFRGRADISRIMLFQELYDSFALVVVTDADFQWSVQQLREIAAEQETISALTEGMQIIRHGVSDTKGNRKYGHVDARTEIMARLSDIERQQTTQDSPEGDIRHEHLRFLKEYIDRKNARLNGSTYAVRVGVPELDIRLGGGLNPGELVIVAGYTSDGKSSFCVNAAWSAAVEQGRNVVVLTSETTRDQYKRKLYARHSTLPQFGLPDGINSKDIKEANLAPDQERALGFVAQDLDINSNYGTLYVAQVRRGETLASCEARLYRYQRKFNIDVVYIDYLALLRSDVRRNSDREYLASIIKEAKQLATTFDNGRGIPVVSPWQVSRAAKTWANTNGRYESEHLAETAEATNSSDVILALLAMDEGRDARVKNVKLQILKSRDGETMIMSPLEVRVDYGTSNFMAKDAPLARAYQMNNELGALGG